MSTTTPINWTTTSFDEVFSQISTTGKKVKTGETQLQGRFPVVDQGRTFISGYLNDESLVVSDEHPLIIFGDHTREIKWIDFPFIPGADGVKILKPRDELNTRYMYYFLRNLPIKSNGYARHFKLLKEAVYLLPPLAEQTRIAQKLDELLAQVDTLKARIEGIPALLKRFRQSVLAASVSGRLTEEWRQNIRDEGNPTQASGQDTRSRIAEAQPNLRADALSTFRGKTLADLPITWSWKEFRKTAVIASDLQNPNQNPDSFHIAPNHIESMSGKLLEYTTIRNDNVTSAKHRFHKGQILYSKIRPYLCKATIVNFSGLCSADMYPINATINTKYLLLWMLSSQFTDWASTAESRSVLPKINQNDLNKIPVPCPPTNEQTEIVRRVEKLFAFADQLETKVASAKSRIDHLTQSILAKAFRGELVPQDPNDEPASVLLARIQAQRAAAPKAKRGRKASA